MIGVAGGGGAKLPLAFPSLMKAAQMFLPSLLPGKRGSKNIAMRGLITSI